MGQYTLTACVLYVSLISSFILDSVDCLPRGAPLRDNEQKNRRRRLQLEPCSDTKTNYQSPDAGACMTGWSKGNTYEYPDDFDIKNEVREYVCPVSKKRILRSNSIPDHTVEVKSGNTPCVIPWHIELPLYPEKVDLKTEIPPSGMIAIAKNGVPAFGPKEAGDGANAVEPCDKDDGCNIQDAKYWYGHATVKNVWHVHHPYMGVEDADDTTFLGYAMDGFKIYGPLADPDDANDPLDPCNGKLVDGEYRYFVRNTTDVDGDASYCSDVVEVNNWKYILGCYHGDLSNTFVGDNTEESIDDDCVLANPNIIIIQPDDLPFYNEWTPPPNNPNNPPKGYNPLPAQGLPNINFLRTNGVEMRQANTASPACGTSRYSTLTGKYPSRAASARDNNCVDTVPTVTIPTTKLIDSGGQNDCSVENMAQAFSKDPESKYRTGMFGKWHLGKLGNDKSYANAVSIVEACGFDTVGGLYFENLETVNGLEPDYSHNMEWMVSEAISFIDESDDPFLMYFNPTVPHGAQSVAHAFANSTCRETPKEEFTEDIMVDGMTKDNADIDEDTCEAYREWVKQRGSEDEWGSIWLDDAIGALKLALEKSDKLKDTLIIFQEDHGMETKSALYENGVRIPQFVYWQDSIPSATVDKLVSTIDIAPTLFDFAGIDDPGYTYDGVSWKNEVLGGTQALDGNLDKRCLFFEMNKDRVVRCDCQKYLYISDNSVSDTYAKGVQLGYSNVEKNLFDLCNSNGNYETTVNKEDQNEYTTDDAEEYETLMQCHLDRTNHNADNGGNFTQCIREFSPTLSPAPSAPTFTGQYNGWRIWADTSNAQSTSWWVCDLKFYSDSDCTGTNFVDGNGIDSNNVNGYKNKKAFDDKIGSCWRGLEDNDEAFWVGKTFDTSIEVKCISFLDSDSNGVTEMKVQAQNSNGIWFNVAEGENLTPGQLQTIEIASPTTPTTSVPSVIPTPTTSAPSVIPTPTTSAPSVIPSSAPSIASSSLPSNVPSSVPSDGEGGCANTDEVPLIVTVKTDKWVKRDKTQWKIEGKKKRSNKDPKITILGKGNLKKKKNKTVELYNECVVKEKHCYTISFWEKTKTKSKNYGLNSGFVEITYDGVYTKHKDWKKKTTRSWSVNVGDSSAC